jgi:hypothetical protein
MDPNRRMSAICGLETSPVLGPEDAKPLHIPRLEQRQRLPRDEGIQPALGSHQFIVVQDIVDMLLTSVMLVGAVQRVVVLRNKTSTKRQGCLWHSLPLFSPERTKARSGIRIRDSARGSS